MSILNAEKRSVGLKAKQLRRKGLVPGVLYGKNLEESLCLQFTQNEVVQYLKYHSRGSRVELVIGEEKIPALFRDASYTLTNHPEHLNFQTFLSGEVITTTVPIVIVNKDRVLESIHRPTTEISYRAYSSDLIEKIEIDLQKIKVGEIIRISDLDIANNPNIKILTPLDSIVLYIGNIYRSSEEPQPEPEKKENG